MRDIKEQGTKKIGEEIDHELGAKFVKNFQDACPGEKTAYIIGREILDKILAQPDCAGIKYFNAIDEYGNKTLVYVGIDEKGEIISEYTSVSDKGHMENSKGIVADRAGSEDNLLEEILRKYNW
jgi:hypothetical protein